MKRILGFTLLETMLSVGLFGIVIAILFGAINGFQKGWLKEYSKQSISAQFIRIYRAIDSDVSGTSTTFFYDYIMEGATCKGARWFMYPISKSDTQNPGDNSLSGVNPDGYPVWTRLVVYHLAFPKDDKCSGDKTFGSLNTYCPHKRLVRHEIKLDKTPDTSETGEINFNTDMKKYALMIDDIIKSKYDQSLTLSPGRTVKVVDVRTVQNDILDLTLTREKVKQIKFRAKFVRMIDAQKNIGKSGLELGERELLTNDGDIKDDTLKKYIEEVSWITITNNY